MIWDPVRLSLQVMLVASPAVFIIGLALAVFLAKRTFRGQVVLETVVMLPLVLPPTVLGYGLLRVLGSGSPLQDWFRLDILFTWQAAAIAATIAGIPLMVQAARAGVRNVDPTLEHAAANLGADRLTVLLQVTLPMAKRGIIAGTVLGTLRAFGEFGATMMVAGSIPGRTQTMPLAVYDAVQVRDFDLANTLVVIMVALSFIGLFLARRLSR
ncbi:MAG: molybdate ABC transporter permease subunit [Sphaerobacteraceae bacterium]|nr:MAG: molybdate ABC transporter permease subunit [Sphaerobacteraceae bacterium]